MGTLLLQVTFCYFCFSLVTCRYYGVHGNGQPKQRLKGPNVCGSNCCTGWTQAKPGALCITPVCEDGCGDDGVCVGPRLCRCPDGSVKDRCITSKLKTLLDERYSFDGQCSQSQAVCEHLCQAIATNKFRCACLDGHKLLSNGRSCGRDQSISTTNRHALVNHANLENKLRPNMRTQIGTKTMSYDIDGGYVEKDAQGKSVSGLQGMLKPLAPPTPDMETNVEHSKNGKPDKVKYIEGSGKRGLIEESGKRGLINGSGKRGLIEGSGKRGLIKGSGKRGLIEGSGKRGIIDVSGKKSLNKQPDYFTLKRDKDETDQEYINSKRGKHLQKEVRDQEYINSKRGKNLQKEAKDQEYINSKRGKNLQKEARDQELLSSKREKSPSQIDKATEYSNLKQLDSQTGRHEKENFINFRGHKISRTEETASKNYNFKQDKELWGMENGPENFKHDKELWGMEKKPDNFKHGKDLWGKEKEPENFKHSKELWGKEKEPENFKHDKELWGKEKEPENFKHSKELWGKEKEPENFKHMDLWGIEKEPENFKHGKDLWRKEKEPENLKHGMDLWGMEKEPENFKHGMDLWRMEKEPANFKHGMDLWRMEKEPENFKHGKDLWGMEKEPENFKQDKELWGKEKEPENF